MIVVSDTSPVNYLILIGEIDRLYELYRRVIVPSSVYHELQAAETPPAVHSWLAQRPEWVDVVSLSKTPEPNLDYLGEGERDAMRCDAMRLAEQLGAGGLLIDDRDGRREAQRRELRVIGTLGVLAAAAEKGLLNLPEAIERLKGTTFRASPRLYEALLKRFEGAGLQ